MARVLAIDIGTSSIRAAIYGQSLQPVRQATQVRYRWRAGGDGFRAGLEAVGYQFLEVLEELVTVTAVTRLVATGGALTSSRVWPQILADVLGRQIALPRATELTSRGAAMIGFELLGVTHRKSEPGISRVFHPDARSHAVYRAAAVRQQKLLRAVLT